MRISQNDWKNYISKLSKLSYASGALIEDWIEKNGLDDPKALVDYAYRVVQKYGNGSAALSATMYDVIADLQGAIVPPAEMAPLPKYGEVSKTVYGTLKTSQNPSEMGGAVSRLVKRAGADTTLQNAQRDRAEFAWIPSGDTCAFCLTLASRGWQTVSKKALKNGHAEHIHSNCNCEYAIRFDKNSGVAGYDPDVYKAMYDNAEGKNSKDKINYLRRMQYESKSDREKNNQETKTKTVETDNKNKYNIIKQEYTPKQTISECEEYAKQYVDTDQFGALGVLYNGIGVDAANDINRTIEAFYKQYEVDKFGGLYAPQLNSKLGKSIEGAHAGYTKARNSILLNKKSLSSSENLEKILAEEKSVISQYLNNPDGFDLTKLSKRAQEVLKNSVESGRGSVPDNVEDVINHELGHALSDKIYRLGNYDIIAANMSKYAPKISGYACESMSEYLAESFCSYKKGESVIDPELIKAFETLERKYE